jgi:AcrR family transcriptional regulator
MRKVDPVRHEERRSEILAAAERCFARSGFHAATIAQICAEACISPGHLYHYYPNKEAIVAAIIDAGLQHVSARIDVIMDAPDAVGSLVAEFERLRLGLGKSNPGVVLDIFAEASRNPAIARLLRKHSVEMRTQTAALLRKGQARGQVDPTLNPDVAAAVLISLIDATKTLAIREPRLDAEETARTLKALVTRFLSPPGGRKIR